MEKESKENLNETMPDVQLETTALEPSYYYNEEDLAEDHRDDFSYVIRQRGEDYYNDCHVLSIFKNGNNYIARVEGNASEPYDVSITVYGDYIEYECTCPCDFPCKHEYAVLLSISNLEYEKVELKPRLKEKKTNIQDLIEAIPAEEIKNYLLSPVGKEKVIVEMNAFEEYFKKYFPAQSYEYYYNNLYNNLVLERDYDKIVYNYLDIVKHYITGNDFEESYKIIKAIIAAYGDSNKINFDDGIIDVLLKIGVFLRITYRKSDKKVKEEINNWVKELEKQNYYDNFYLEDLILSLK